LQSIILDSNILVKLVVNEPGSSEVRKYIEALLREALTYAPST